MFNSIFDIEFGKTNGFFDFAFETRFQCNSLFAVINNIMQTIKCISRHQFKNLKSKNFKWVKNNKIPGKKFQIPFWNEIESIRDNKKNISDFTKRTSRKTFESIFIQSMVKYANVGNFPRENFTKEGVSSAISVHFLHHGEMSELFFYFILSHFLLSFRESGYIILPISCIRVDSKTSIFEIMKTP